MNKYFNAMHLMMGVLFIPSLVHASHAKKATRVHSSRLYNAQVRLKARPFEFFSITVPKSGTHLLSKCISLMKAQDPYSFSDKTPRPKPDNEPQLCTLVPHNAFPMLQEERFKDRIIKKHRFPRAGFHLAHTQDRAKFLKQSAKAILFMIRDPRDQLISITKWCCDKSKLKSPEFSDMLLNFIDGKQRGPIYAVKMIKPASYMWSYGIADYYTLYTPWMGADKVYTVHFENLVGSRGGGSDEAQAQEIANIAHHLNIRLTPQKIAAIADNLFGGTNTFNKGQIGTWKEYFTEEHKQAFKNTAGQLLIDLGYEKDMNW